MSTTYFIIPKTVYWYCILPALCVIIGAIIISLIYHHKKGTYYYTYHINNIYNIASILLCLILLPLLVGYCFAIGKVILSGLLKDMSFLLFIVLFLLPTIPLATLIIVCNKFIKNLRYKDLLDQNIDNVVK